MRAVIQRVSEASVTIDGLVKHAIKTGLLVLVAFEEADSDADIEWLCSKTLQMRLFPDEDGKMNLALADVQGELLVISQFTLYASTKKGNRPSFLKSAKPETALPLYEKTLLRFEQGLLGKVGSGEFGADMKIALVNDGPVTINLDSKNKN